MVNFFILLIASRHLFDLPFKNFREIMRSRELLEAKPLGPKGKKKTTPPKLVAVPPPAQPQAQAHP